MRKFYYKLLLLMYLPVFILRKVKVGKGVRVEPRVFLSKSSIGDYSYVGHNCVIDNTIIGNYCSIAAFVQLGGMEHSHWWLSMSTYLSNIGKKEKTVIGNDVWIGSKVSVRGGVTIGNGAVIGSNAVVLKDVDPYTIVAGVPAKVIGKRLNDELIVKLEDSKYYNEEPNVALRILESIDNGK
ncbi:CatB-related O-acetyltransferase [Myroides odoratimimus]|uniref:CatB-related O-acetyltransferase n=1 Tax=Myroides odoratimimus TaxID=76832 RepID=UPI0025750B25|nr:CatB-related O-acetyltransferase [Myroides odoratimimus]MDM1086234.1 CatB-related O-acetyltransferase [Myroides odoratimimus]